MMGLAVVLVIVGNSSSIGNSGDDIRDHYSVHYVHVQ